MSERSNERITDELLICDSEEAYVKRLAELLLLKKEVTMGVRTCSLPEHVEHLIEIGNVKVLLISEVVPYQERKRLFAGKRIVLTREHCADLGIEETELNKYQSVNNIVKIIVQTLSENPSGILRRKNGRKKMIGVYSPVHRIGKTTFALKAGKELAEEENVLYLNLEAYAGFGGYFQWDEGQDLSHLLYYSRQENDMLGVRMASMVHRMGSLDYILPIKVSTDLQSITTEEWQNLFQRLSKESIYETFLIDIGDSVGDLMGLLEMCDWIFVPYAEDIYAKAKMEQWQYMLEVLKKQHLNQSEIRINMEQNMRQAVAEAITELQKREGMS